MGWGLGGWGWKVLRVGSGDSCIHGSMSHFGNNYAEPSSIHPSNVLGKACHMVMTTDTSGRILSHKNVPFEAYDTWNTWNTWIHGWILEVRRPLTSRNIGQVLVLYVAVTMVGYVIVLLVWIDEEVKAIWTHANTHTHKPYIT